MARRDTGAVIEADLDYLVGHLKDEFRQMAGKRLLITGGAGFLGYYLVPSALHWNKTRPRDEAIAVTVFDIFMQGMPSCMKALESDVSFTSRTHDMCRPLPDDMPDFEYIIHAASIASPHYYRKHPIETMDANINVLRNLLDYSCKQKSAGHPVEGFMFYSTSEIYGDPVADEIPTSEEYRGHVSCTGPRACYNESKRYGETLCVNFARQFDLPIKVTRPFNNYGPGLKIGDKRVLPDFANDVLHGRDIVMLSDGAPSRTFCYVADAVVGHYKVLVKGQQGEAYNIGADNPEISIADLAERVVSLARELFDYEGKVVRQISDDKDYLVDNPNRRCPDIGKARRELGYETRIELNEGLRRALIWYSAD